MPEPTEHVQTKREIEQLLAERGIRPRKMFAQHFLVDGNLMRRLAESADITHGDAIMEVGAGTGGLTDLLAPRAERLLCVEIDRDLFPILLRRFGANDRITLIEGDVLRSKHELRESVAEWILTAGRDGLVVKLVANLPYQIATPLIMNLIVGFAPIRRLCFTVQLEVGERITAGPGTKAYGPLAIVTQSVCDVRTIVRIGPQSFWPRPAVDSIMLRLDVVRNPFPAYQGLGRFAQFVRSVFEHRRKTLRAAAGYSLLPEELSRIEPSNLSRRPEQIPVSQWLEMYAALGRVP